MHEPHIEPYQLEFARDLVEAAHESVDDMNPWMPWCTADFTERAAKEWISEQVVNWREGRSYEFAIIGRDGRYLGGCGLNQLVAAHRVANLGYWVRTSATGHSVAPAAVEALAAWGFENTDLERLEIVCALANERSQRVAEKAGAYREGVLRSRLHLHGVPHDAVLYSIVRSGPSADVPSAPAT